MGHTRTGANTVDSYAFTDLLVGQTSGKRYNSSLGRRIVKEIRSTNVMVNRRAVDYSRAPFHVREGVLGEIEEWMDVGIERILPLIPVGLSASSRIYAA